MLLVGSVLIFYSLCPCFLSFLESGRALIGAKRYYFGVGGSTALFAQRLSEDAAAEADPSARLTSQVIKVIENGASNLREIVEVSFAPSQ